MTLSWLRILFCCMIMAVVPAALLAGETPAAMLYANGTAWLNGITAPRSSAIFAGDMVQTKSDAVVHINATGSSVLILSDSLVKFEGNAVSVEHGSVSVATSKSMGTRAGEVTVVPVSSAWTRFEVTDVNGTVQILARQGDVSVSNGTETTRLAQGEQTTRDDSENRKKKRRAAAGAVPGAAGSVMDSPYAIAVGGAAVGGIVLWVLLQGDEPASPVIP
jgi:hypothetical protein